MKKLAVLIFSIYAGLLVAISTSFFQSTANADSLRRERLNLSLDRQDGVSRLNIELPENLKVEHFQLSDPPRYVVDIFGLMSKRSRTFPLPLDPAIDRLRLGAHPDRCRLVLDLHEPVTPDIKITGERVVISVGSSMREPLNAQGQKITAFVDLIEQERASAHLVNAVAAPPVLALEFDRATAVAPKFDARAVLKELRAPLLIEAAYNTQNPQTAEPAASTIHVESAHVPQPESAELPDSVAAATAIASLPVEEPSLLPGEFAARMREITPAPAVLDVNPPDSILPVGQALTAINFKGSEKESLIELDFSQGPEFDFIKTNNDRYTLKIKNSGVRGDHLLLPYFPPQGFPGLLFVSPAKADNNLVITFGVEPECKLSAYAQGTNILIGSRASP